MEEKLKSLLEKVPDTYPDFVLGTWLEVKNNEEHINQMIEFLQDNPQASTSAVIVACNKIIGLKTFAELEAEQNSNN